jgi:leader peptidase (prepilin peptidase) / N-methyltransferase
VDGTISADEAPATAISRLRDAHQATPDPSASASSFRRQQLAGLTLAVALGALSVVSYSSLADRLIAAFVAVVLVTLAVTDLERRIIPNRVVLPALAILLVARTATEPSPRWVLATLGAGLFFLLPNLINSSAMGMGDVKLAAFLGAGLGTAVIGALLIASLSTVPFVGAKLIRGGLAARKSTLPFGPFLAFGGLLILIVPRLIGAAGG